jgi:membrane protease subunit HflK
VHWHIRDLQKFLFHSRSAEAIIRAAADSALREIVAKTPIDLVVAEARERINQDAQKLLQKLLDTYDLGVGIIEFILQRADPPDAVMDAFRDVQRAKADQERARNEAYAYRNDILPKARGQARQMILEAEAYQKSMVSKAEGEAGRFTAILAEYRKAPDVTRSRLSIETMEQVMAKTPKVLIDPSVANVVPYLPLPALKTQTSKTQANPVKTEGTP